MEIRNNTPSFGMAFRKPQDIEKFTKYVVGNQPEFIVKRGLSKVIKEQSGNVHYDIEYGSGNTFLIIPTSADAQRLGTPEYSIPVKNQKLDDVRSRLADKYYTDAYSQAYDKASKPKRVLMSAKKFFASLRLVFRELVTNPEDALPKNLRLASKRATMHEAVVDRKLAQEAKDLARKQKLEASIESLFPKEVE